MKKNTAQEVEKVADVLRGEEVTGYELVKYADFNRLINAMQDYVATTGNRLEVRDDPFRLRLGFVDEANKKWFIIRLVDVKKTIESMLPEQRDTFQNSVQSEEGRLLLLEVINKHKKK